MSREVVLTFSDSRARTIESYLRERYGKDKRTSLSTLCAIAVRREVMRQAREELKQAESEL